ANSSPVVGAQRQPWDKSTIILSTLKGLMSHRPNAFSVCRSPFCDPGLSLRANPGLELANAFGVVRIRILLSSHQPTSLQPTKRSYDPASQHPQTWHSPSLGSSDKRRRRWLIPAQWLARSDNPGISQPSSFQP